MTQSDRSDSVATVDRPWWKRLKMGSSLGHAYETAAILADREKRRAAPAELYLDRAHRAFAEGRIDQAEMERRIETVLRGGWVPE